MTGDDQPTGGSTVRGRAPLVLAAALLWLAGCAEARAEENGPAPESAELARLYAARDPFGLRDRLGAKAGESVDPVRRFYAAAVEHAFNRSRASLELLDGLGEADLPAALSGEAERLRMDDLVRLHRYREALEVARAVARGAEPRHPVRERLKAENMATLLAALSDTPPQSARIDAFTRMRVDFDGTLPVAIGDRTVRLSPDSGAGFSVISRSEAETAGLVVRPVGFEILAGTGRSVEADVAVAPRVVVGNATLDQVVFLVLDDALLRSGNRDLPGLLGFPVLSALGELRFRRDGVLEIPDRPARRRQGNLALAGQEPLVAATYDRERLLCRLDTGAALTVFYEPFYRRFGERLEGRGERLTVQEGGIGGRAPIPVLRLPRIALTVASRGVTLRPADIYTRPVRAVEDNFIDCNLGRDLLGQHRAYVVNFHDMALVLE